MVLGKGKGRIRLNDRVGLGSTSCGIPNKSLLVSRCSTEEIVVDVCGSTTILNGDRFGSCCGVAIAARQS